MCLQCTRRAVCVSYVRRVVLLGHAVDVCGYARVGTRARLEFINGLEPDRLVSMVPCCESSRPESISVARKLGTQRMLAAR